MIENGRPVPSPHHTQQQHGQPTNDTAFPGGPLRHSYAVAGQDTHTILTTIAPNQIKEPKQVLIYVLGYKSASLSVSE